MFRVKSYSIVLLLVFCLCSCKNSSGDLGVRTLSDIPEPSATDTLSSLYGEKFAEIYREEMGNDSVAMSQKGKLKYLEGVKLGLELTDDDENRNQGVSTGVRLGIAVREFEDKYGIKLSPAIIIGTLQEYLLSDSIVAISDVENRIRQKMIDLTAKNNTNK